VRAGRFVAKLTGETDDHLVSRVFLSKASAIAWVLGDGLADFDDQEATGEVLDANGRVVWLRLHLQNVESADRERTRDAARLGMVVRPMRGRAGYRFVPLKKGET
jgi:hypothetical protein